MQRKFITNLGLLLLLNLLIKPFWILGIDRSVQNIVGAEEYGIYYALFNFSFLLNIVLDVGITNFNTKNIAQNRQLISKHFSSIAVLKLLLALVYIVLTFTCGWIIGYSLGQMKFVLLLGFNQFLISMILYLRSNLAGLHHFKTYSAISVLDRALMIAICAVLLWGNITNRKFQIEWFVYAQTAAYLLTSLIAFVMVALRAESFRPRWSFPFSVMIIKQSFPFAVLILLMTFYNRIDAVMMERMLPDGATQAGIYAQAYRLLDATNMIAFLFAGLLLPIFARMLILKESIEKLLALSFRLLVVPALIIAACSYFYRIEIMGLLYDEYTEFSSPVFGLLMACFIPVSLTYIFGTLLTANGNLKALNIMAACGILLNVALNFVLIPKLFAYGSAIASLITQIITATIQVMVVQYVFRFRVNYRLILAIAVFVTGILMIGYFSRMLDYNWVTNAGIMAIGCVAWAFITRVISLKSMYEIIKYGE